MQLYPSTENWIKDLLSMALSTRTRPGFPTTSSSHQEAGTSLLSSSIRGQTEEVWTITPQPPEQKPQSQKANQNDHMDHSLVKSMKLWDMPCRATQDRWVMMESSDKKWFTEERNGKPLQHSCLENPMNSMKKQRDTKLKDELLRSVCAQYATGEEWRNISRRNE